jgi:hypothetical protein
MDMYIKKGFKASDKLDYQFRKTTWRACFCVPPDEFVLALQFAAVVS